MRHAIVTGTVTCTMHVDGLAGIPLLLVQPVDRHRRPDGHPLVAADAVHQAGPGDLVQIVASREAAEAFPDRTLPLDHAIVAITDLIADHRP